MKINFKQTVCTSITLFTLVAAGSLFAKDKTAGEKVDHAINKTENAVTSAKDKAKELANDAKDKGKEVVDKTKEMAKEAKDKVKK